MTQQRIRLVVIVAALFTALVSFYSIWKRHEAESQNRAVALAVEFETAESYASSQGSDIEHALISLKAQGLNSVVLGEETISELIAEGKAAVVTTAGSDGSSASSLRFNDKSEMERVQQGLRIRFHDFAGRLTPRGDLLMLPPTSVQHIRSTAIGLNPKQVELAQKLKLVIIARCSNPAGISEKTVQETLAWAHERGATVFLPQGDQVLGRLEALQSTIDTLETLGMTYASPEFAKIGGDTEIVEKAPGLVVRLHSAQAAELDKLGPVEAVERYVKAARERNMRVLLIRPRSFAAVDPLESLGTFIREIDHGITKQGIVIGRPHVFHEPHVPKALFILLGLVCAPVVWSVGARFTTNPKILIAGAILAALLGLACATKSGQQLMALAGSMAFPIAGFFMLDDWLSNSKGNRWSTILIGFIIVSAFSVIGGMLVGGMLNGLPFYVKASEFKAIKLSVFLPIIVVGFHYFMRLTNWKADLRSPITWGTSALSLAIMISLALMLARTGNDSGVGASGGEMVFRNLLDRFLYVRPRTKEFMIGHPILFVAIGLLLHHMRREKQIGAAAQSKTRLAGWTVLALMLGAIGQTSVVNTMCHLHIPVMLSLARIMIGLVLGCIIGVGSWLVVSRWVPEREA